MVIKKTGISHELLIHPGETIADILEERGISQAELAFNTGVTPTYISNVINGKKDISAKFALRLEYALGVSKKFWLNLQANYDAELLELYEITSITCEEFETREHLKYVLSYLRKRNMIPKRQSKEESVVTLRKLFKISDISNLKNIQTSAAFRISQKVNVDPYVLGAWIRMCQMVSENCTTNNNFEVNNLNFLIKDLKDIMVNDNGDIQNKLIDVFEKHGICFSILKHFRGAPVHGYVAYLQENVYQIVLTIRRTYADEFWFSLFHEIGHIVNGDINNGRFIDDGSNDDIERKADKFAEDALLDRKSYQEFIDNYDFTIESIREFAKTQNVMDYIVIGRLKREGFIKYNQFAQYMKQYDFSEIN